MKTVGLITEYNPFHNGHAYHIKKAKEETGSDYVIVVMSGDYVQRGVPAIFDKYVRTRMALLGGADLVFELPVRFATGSAEYFARGGICLLNGLGVTDTLCFGSESNDLALLQRIAKILLLEPEPYQTALRQRLKSGAAFPAARQDALLSLCPAQSKADLLEVVHSPNNILGIEYCKALEFTASSIKPHSILRIGKGYHDTDLKQPFASASAIRKHLSENALSLPPGQIPPSIRPYFYQTLHEEGWLSAEDFFLPLRYRLMLETPDSLTNYLDVSPDLANRIHNRMDQFSSWETAAQLLKTRELTHSRISRSLLHILLNIHTFSLTDCKEPLIPYGRILGFRKTAAPLLNQIKKNSSIPLVSKLANRRKLLSDEALSMLEEDIWCSNLYESIKAVKRQRSFVHEVSRPICIL